VSLLLFSESYDGSVFSSFQEGSDTLDSVTLFVSDGISVGCMGAIDGAVVFRIVGVLVGWMVVVVLGTVVADDFFFWEHLKSAGGSTEY
jgi:hypothetical protein